MSATKFLPIGKRPANTGAAANESGCDLVFNITDGHGQRGIYTGDSSDALPYSFNFVVSNEGDTEYQINPLSGEITSSNCHFYLQFDTPFIKQSDVFPCTSDPNWAYGTYPASDDSELVGYLYLGWVGSEPLPFPPGLVCSIKIAVLYNSTVALNETIEITTYVGTDNFSPAPGCTNAIDFSVQLLTPVNQLLCQAAGPNSVLNDGSTPCSFVVRLYNPSDLAVTLAPQSEVFRISIDTVAAVGDTGQREALTLTDAAANISVTLDPSVQDRYSVDASKATGDNNLRISWTVRTLSEKPLSIGPLEQLQVTFSRVKTPLPPGISNVTVQYLNVLGLENQVHTLPVLKTPFIFYEATVNGNGQAASGTDAPSGLSLVYESQDTSEAAVGALFDFNTENTGLAVKQRNSAKQSARFSGGAGLSIDGVSSGYALSIDGGAGCGGLRVHNMSDGDGGVVIETATSSTSLQVAQTGSGYAMMLNGGKGSLLTGMAGNSFGLTIKSTTTGQGQGLNVQLPSGSCSTGTFHGGSGVIIQSVQDAHTALTISTSSTSAGLQVTQSGSGPSGFFRGGSGLYITPDSSDSYTDPSASLYVKGKTIVDQGDLQVNGNFHVTGDTILEGEVTIKSGRITLGTNSVVILQSQPSPSSDCLELVVLDSSQGIANMRCHGFYSEGWIHLGENGDVVLAQTTSPTGSGYALEVKAINAGGDANIQFQDAWALGGLYIGSAGTTDYSMLTYNSSPTDSKGGGFYVRNYLSGSLNSDWAQGAVDTQSGTTPSDLDQD